MSVKLCMVLLQMGKKRQDLVLGNGFRDKTEAGLLGPALHPILDVGGDEGNMGVGVFLPSVLLLSPQPFVEPADNVCTPDRHARLAPSAMPGTMCLIGHESGKHKDRGAPPPLPQRAD